MEKNDALTLLGKLAICLLALFVAFMTSNLSIAAGGILAFCGVVNGAAWLAALIWFGLTYIKPKTDADKFKK